MIEEGRVIQPRSNHLGMPDSCNCVEFQSPDDDEMLLTRFFLRPQAPLGGSYSTVHVSLRCCTFKHDVVCLVLYHITEPQGMLSLSLSSPNSLPEDERHT